jgi:hypothetical protein
MHYIGISGANSTTVMFDVATAFLYQVREREEQEKNGNGYGLVRSPFCSPTDAELMI